MANQFAPVIVDGPRKGILILALFDDQPMPVTFKTFSPTSGQEVALELVVDSVEREDASGASWIIKAHFVAGATHGFPSHLMIHYSTKTRRGTISAGI